MTQGALYPEGCTAPDVGRLVDDYLASRLTEQEGALFEEHYFKCAACLEAIRIRQSGPHALAQWRQRLKGRNRHRIIAAVVVVLAVATIALLVFVLGRRS